VHCAEADQVIDQLIRDAAAQVVAAPEDMAGDAEVGGVEVEIEYGNLLLALRPLDLVNLRVGRRPAPRH
jgi:hypothetical protein